MPISSTRTLITIAGQIGQDPQTDTIPSTLGEQCSLAFKNMDKCLAAVGADKTDIVHVRHYVVNLLRDGQGQDPERAKRYVAWMDGAKPPSTLLGVQTLAHQDLLYEIEVVAVLKEDNHALRDT